MTSINMETPDSIAADLFAKHTTNHKSDLRITLIIFGVLAAACLIPFIYFLTQLSSSSSSIVGVIVSGTFLGGLLLPCLLMLCFTGCQRRFQKRLLKDAAQFRPVVWRLDGEQWRSYLDHIFGNDHPGNTFGFGCTGCSWCCRKNQVQKLSDRGYGYIVFYPCAIIIDELFVIVPDMTREPGAVLVPINQHQKAVRIHLMRSDGDGGVIFGYVDLFVPYRIQQANDRLLDLAILINQSFNKEWKKNSPQYFEKFRSSYDPSAIRH